MMSDRYIIKDGIGIKIELPYTLSLKEKHSISTIIKENYLNRLTDIIKDIKDIKEVSKIKDRNLVAGEFLISLDLFP